MRRMEKPRYGVDPYLDWIKAEGLPVAEDYGIDLFAVETAPWARYGVKGAAVHLKGRGDFANMFLLDIPPGGSTAPQRHLYEEVIYVLEGTGSTQLEFADGTQAQLRMGRRAACSRSRSTPSTAISTAAASERALLVSTTDLPLIMNIFHNEAFIFDNDFEFAERTGKNEYYSGEGDLIMVRPGNHMWETNFVPDLAAIELKSWGDRGAGGTNIMFVLADGTMHAHISEMPVGTYKKAHRHGPGFHVMCVIGARLFAALVRRREGLPAHRLEARHRVPAGRPAVPPAFQHQRQPGALSRDRRRRPALSADPCAAPLAARRKPGEKGAVSPSIKEGGDQIEYEDQDPRIHRSGWKRCARTASSPRWRNSSRTMARGIEAAE